jgi:hypothetical protein
VGNKDRKAKRHTAGQIVKGQLLWIVKVRIAMAGAATARMARTVSMMADE